MDCTNRASKLSPDIPFKDLVAYFYKVYHSHANNKLSETVLTNHTQTITTHVAFGDVAGVIDESMGGQAKKALRKKQMDEKYIKSDSWVGNATPTAVALDRDHADIKYIEILRIMLLNYEPTWDGSLVDKNGENRIKLQPGASPVSSRQY